MTEFQNHLICALLAIAVGELFIAIAIFSTN